MSYETKSLENGDEFSVSSLPGDIDQKFSDLTAELAQTKEYMKRLNFAQQRPMLASGNLQNAASEHKQAFMDYMRTGNRTGLDQITQKGIPAFNPEGNPVFPPSYKILFNKEDTVKRVQDLTKRVTLSADSMELLIPDDKTCVQFFDEAKITKRIDTSKFPYSMQPEDTTSLIKKTLRRSTLYMGHMVTKRFLEQENIIEDLAENASQQFSEKIEHALLFGGQYVENGNVVMPAQGEVRPEGLLIKPEEKSIVLPFKSICASSMESEKKFAPHKEKKNDFLTFLSLCTQRLALKYHGGASWLVSHPVYQSLLDLTGADGRGLLNALTDGGPKTLMGYPLHVVESLPSATDNKLHAAHPYPLVFGNFKRAYVYGHQDSPPLFRDDTPYPYIRFLIERAFGGTIVDPSALVFADCSK